MPRKTKRLGWMSTRLLLQLSLAVTNMSGRYFTKLFAAPPRPEVSLSVLQALPDLALWKHGEWPVMTADCLLGMHDAENPGKRCERTEGKNVLTVEKKHKEYHCGFPDLHFLPQITWLYINDPL